MLNNSNLTKRHSFKLMVLHSKQYIRKFIYYRMVSLMVNHIKLLFAGFYLKYNIYSLIVNVKTYVCYARKHSFKSRSP